MKKIAIVLSGCGHKDGSEITEAVSTLIALGQNQATATCFAPDKSVACVDHIDDQPCGERSILSESTRITRAPVLPIHQLNPDDYDAVIFPGGMGAALHLSSWADEGAQCQVLPDVVRVIQGFHSQSKPIGAICVAPVLIAKVLGGADVTVTVGSNAETISEIKKTGSHHEICDVTDYITDRANKVVTTPAYMYGQARPEQVFMGISGMIKELVEMA